MTFVPVFLDLTNMVLEALVKHQKYAAATTGLHLLYDNYPNSSIANED